MIAIMDNFMTDPHLLRMLPILILTRFLTIVKSTFYAKPASSKNALSVPNLAASSS